jgi:hypothetical protein
MPNIAGLAIGAIAQLGERLRGTQEVGGSIPPGSTKTSSEDIHYYPSTPIKMQPAAQLKSGWVIETSIEN